MIACRDEVFRAVGVKISEFCDFVLKLEGPATQWGGVPAKNKR